MKYKNPPKAAYRRMGLGINGSVDGRVKVIAGFKFRWWLPDFAGPIEPLFVYAKILRIHNADKGAQ